MGALPVFEISRKVKSKAVAELSSPRVRLFGNLAPKANTGEVVKNLIGLDRAVGRPWGLMKAHSLAAEANCSGIGDLYGQLYVPKQFSRLNSIVRQVRFVPANVGFRFAR
jgi:hypothetical protein